MYDDKCNCICHEDNNLIHCSPCCCPCKYCGGNIKIEWIEEHENRCKERYEKIRRKVNELVRSSRNGRETRKSQKSA